MNVEFNFSDKEITKFIECKITTLITSLIASIFMKFELVKHF